MSEEINTTAPEPGITLPDDAAPVSSVSATDRLLAFNANGDPVTATAEQVKEYANEGMVTTEAMNTVLATKAAIVPYSLTEQLVPGEFWDGKQVYVRAFKGSVHGVVGGNYIAQSCFKSNAVNIVEAKGCLSGYLSGDSTVYYSFPVGVNWSVRTEGNSLAYSTERADMGAMIYMLTVKYTL